MENEKQKYNDIINLIENSDFNKEYKKELLDFFNILEDDSLFLNALESNGVDNWTWYDEAFKDYEKMKGKDEND